MNSTGLNPILGSRPGRGGDRLLMVCCYDPNGIPTICENIANWQQLSRFAMEIINLWPGRDGALLHLPAGLDMARYAGVILHSTATYSPANLFAMDQRLERPFEEFDGLKILMKQDEQVQTNRFAEYIGRKKIDIVITCVRPDQLAKVYPREVIGDVDFLYAYTGYISPSLRRLRGRAMSARPMDIAYRGSIQALEFGRLGYEKRGIGYDVAAAARKAPELRLDISSRWEDRINGSAWFDFLGQSKVVLGAESGSNLFDFAGDVAAWCRAYEERHADRDQNSRDFYLCAHEEHLHRFEGNVNYATISPRHFEAVAAHTAQLLYEGEYSGVFVPHRHFFPLKRDLSNIVEALDFARDDRRLHEFADCAYEEIVGNPDYHYEHFVAKFDEVVEQRGRRKQRQRSHIERQIVEPKKGAAHKALLLMAHEPTEDPRIDWFSEGLAADFEVCEIGIYRQDVEVTAPSIEQLSARRIRVRVDGRRVQWDFVTSGFGAHRKASVGADAMEKLFVTGQLPLRSLGNQIGALDATEDDLSRFRRLCDYFVRVNSALLEASRRIGGFDVIVVADLEALPAAVALAEEYGVPLVYDAHEYWPYSDLDFRHWEIEFWCNLERTLLERVTLPLTVSPQLAAIMSQQYGCAFDSLPNCASLGSERAVDLEAALATHARSQDVIFLVQGSFAVHRGLEKLINVWDRVDPHAKLWLRGPDNPHKTAMIDLAQSRGVFNRGVFFPDAVAEAELVAAARDADIGLVPYEPIGPNYRYCSPNKLSQYMAAGLPIICNELDFVKSVVVDNGVGAAVDFRDEAALVKTINAYAQNRDSIPALSRKAQALFQTSFNWQAKSETTYASIKNIVSNNEANKSDFDFAWVDDDHDWNSSNNLSAHESQLAQLNDSIQCLALAYRDTHELLQKEIDRLNKVYPNEIARLNNVYTDEIERLRKLNRSSATWYILRHAARPLRVMADALFGTRGKQ